MGDKFVGQLKEAEWLDTSQERFSNKKKFKKTSCAHRNLDLDFYGCAIFSCPILGFFLLRLSSFSGSNKKNIFYNSMSNLVRFENKNIFFGFEKHSGLLQRWLCSF
jgi:hypothetical protein